QEWGLRVTLNPAGLRAHAEAASERLQELARGAANAPPGRAYLLTKQRERLVASEAERLAGESLTAIYQQLAGLADATRQDDLPPNQAAGVPRLVLKASFLVATAERERFGARAAELARTHAPGGLAVELSGPWAPYSFVGKPVR